MNDVTVGKALKITTSDNNFYAIDYELQSLTKELGNFLEIVANFPDDKSSLYVFIEMTNNNGDVIYGWLRFKVGKESQKIPGEQEWLVYGYPESFLDQSWLKIQINLRKVVQETFGKDGSAILTGCTRTVETGKELRHMAGHTAGVENVIFSPDGKFIASVSDDGTARPWDVDYHDTMDYLCSRLLRDFTEAERAQYGIPDDKPTCPGE